MNQRPFVAYVIVGIAAVLVSSCCSQLILYKPTGDLSSVILSLKIPKIIETLSGFPRDETYVEMGINRNTGTRQSDNVKERFKLFIAATDEQYSGTQYYFSLFFTEAYAKRYYEFYKSAFHEFWPIFIERQSVEMDYYITYIKQPRSDGGGLCLPMNFYMSNSVKLSQTQGRP